MQIFDCLRTRITVTWISYRTTPNDLLRILIRIFSENYSGQVSNNAASITLELTLADCVSNQRCLSRIPILILSIPDPTTKEGENKFVVFLLL
jgi:hypothetical protein